MFKNKKNHLHNKIISEKFAFLLLYETKIVKICSKIQKNKIGKKLQ